MSWFRILGTAVLTASVLSLTVSSVDSAIPNPTNGKFYACMNKKTKAIKMLNYPKRSACDRGWKLIQWNARGVAGATGPVGPVGPAGPAGDPGVTKVKLSIEAGPLRSLDHADQWEYADAACDAGKVVGGGWYLDSGTATSINVTDSYPLDQSTWRIQVHSMYGGDKVQAFAICMTSDPPAVIARITPSAKRAIGRASRERS